MTDTIKALEEINRLVALDGVEVIKVSCQETETLVESHDTDKTLFVKASLTPVEDFTGDFGITDLKMLGSCLKFHGTQDVKLKIGTRKIMDQRVMDEIEFRGKGAKSIFKLMDAAHIPKQAKIADIPWSITIDEVGKERIKDFSSFAQMFSGSDGHFDITTRDGKLVFAFGREASSTHSGTLEFSDVEGDITTALSFPVSKFTMMLKLAAANEKSKLMFSDKGLLGVEIQTELGVYHYYLRQVIR